MNDTLDPLRITEVCDLLESAWLAHKAGEDAKIKEILSTVTEFEMGEAVAMLRRLGYKEILEAP